jgi:hypothetical protein
MAMTDMAMFDKVRCTESPFGDKSHVPTHDRRGRTRLGCRSRQFHLPIVISLSRDGAVCKASQKNASNLPAASNQSATSRVREHPDPGSVTPCGRNRRAVPRYAAVGR